MLFMSTKSYAEDVVYEHRWAQMSTDDAQMMHRDVVYKHRWWTRWAQDVVYEHKMLFMSTKNIKSNFFLL